MFGDTPLVMVDSTEGLEALVAHLETLPVIGVDTESDSFHSYREKLCLIQVSDDEKDYIIDPLKIDDMSALGRVLANPDVIKVLHGADYDVVCMQRDYGFRIRGLFDTGIAAMFLGHSRFGLADLVERYFGHTIDKKYQRYDWSKRPLPADVLDYARGDTHWLLAIHELMHRHLVKVRRVRAVAEECKRLERKKWSAPRDEVAWLRVKGVSALDDDEKRVYKYVWEYREGEAERQDRPTFKVIPGDLLLKLARRKPTTDSELERIMGRRTKLQKRYGSGLLAAVREGVDADWDIPRVPRPRRVKSKDPVKLKGRAAERMFLALKDWRNQTVDDNDPPLNPLVVANNTTLKTIAAALPETLEELEALSEVRRWQVRHYGEALLQVVADNRKLAESEPQDDAPKKKRRRRRKKKTS